MKAGLVTTIIPVYNRSAMLREAVASVLAQTYRPIEILIVDDGSTDDTAAVVDGLARVHPEIRAIHQENAGPGVAREAARKIAEGEFIQHLDSDDVLLPEKFERQVAALHARPECGAAYCRTLWRYHGVIERDPLRRTGERIETMFPAMLKSRWWHTATPLYRASLLQQAGSWLPLRLEEDWEYDARIAAQGVRLAYVDGEPLCEVRRHALGHASGNAISRDALRDRTEAHARIFEHARRAGIGFDVPEMRHFARELFLIARQAGAAGLEEESKRMFELARTASGDRRNAL
ncbi:MAG TPA: glycosyltransferase family A protein, partial [Thermoanaerobaculia bacterium]